MSFVVSGSMGGSAQSFIKGKCCQDAGRLKARRCRCDLCSRHGAINHPAFVSTGCRFCRRRRHRCCCKTQPSLPRLRQAQTSKHAYAVKTRKRRAAAGEGEAGRSGEVADGRESVMKTDTLAHKDTHRCGGRTGRHGGQDGNFPSP